MAEANPTANPPAAHGGVTKDDVNAILASALKPITDTLKGLGDNQRVLADTLAKLPPAPAAAPAAGDKKPEPLSEERIAQIVADRLEADRKAQREQAQQADAVKAAKDRIVKDKLGGDADLAAFLPDTADEAQLTAAAEKLAPKVTPKATLPGTGADGGKPPARQPVDYSKLNASQKVQLGVNQLLADQAK